MGNVQGSSTPPIQQTHSAEKIERAERIATALRMRVAGKSPDDVAAHFGIHKSTAYRLIKDGIDRTIREPAEELVALHMLRLETMLAGVWPDARAGDVKAINAALAILAREGKLQGLDLHAAQKALQEGRELAAVDKWLEHMVGKAITDAM
ncbi:MULTISPECIES: helix-turn-helix domain-containing protein [unclassified Nocardia]|uniref:helix-turn-helix domain-containing protein n=1 Tax=unclassified Nocardia TaxID=2637762 RepID=UPI002E15BBD2|nr:helix-turn-helix domain-containing protein [Nocardia sp. NBC_01327]